MKFTINSTELLQRLTILSKSQSSKSPIPILDCVKMELS